ncbi:MAG: 30S ribosomal protein S6--L-glutamate ligase [Phaeodactylibacter sp.]|nr:30S ribosomal protein S6--L-glutamate ligase [Phaeodactylibacter sp.]MCB9053141.1 30S ribosomal protein S6--L-glutamate ligase [Lewinellaceae bacterium]
MKIAILSRGPQLYSTQSLVRAGINRGHSMQIVDHTRCTLAIGRGRPKIYYNDYQLERFDAVIPRIGASVTAQGASVISQFEMMQCFTVARSEALLQARDKLRCLQKLARCGIEVPRTASVATGEDLMLVLREAGGLPIVIKLLESTHGNGVILADTYRMAESVIEAFQRLGERVIIQEFIHEAKGADIRALVVAGEVVAAMKRQARGGEFRSNLHRGATAEAITLTDEEDSIVKKSAKMLGLDVAGVDFLRSKRGPLVMEVNASPGLEGIEGITGVDVAGKVIEFIERRCEELRNFEANNR